MGKATNMLYPLRNLSKEEHLINSRLIATLLDEWEQGLPQFLKPTNRTFTGKRMFERNVIRTHQF
jgi:hypothetical protein